MDLVNYLGQISRRRSREGLNDPEICWIAFRLPTQSQAGCTISAASQGQMDPSHHPATQGKWCLYIDFFQAKVKAEN